MNYRVEALRPGDGFYDLGMTIDLEDARQSGSRSLGAYGHTGAPTPADSTTDDIVLDGEIAVLDSKGKSLCYERLKEIVRSQS